MFRLDGEEEREGHTHCWDSGEKVGRARAERSFRIEEERKNGVKKEKRKPEKEEGKEKVVVTSLEFYGPFPAVAFSPFKREFSIPRKSSSAVE